MRGIYFLYLFLVKLKLRRYKMHGLYHNYCSNKIVNNFLAALLASRLYCNTPIWPLFFQFHLVQHDERFFWNLWLFFLILTSGVPGHSNKKIATRYMIQFRNSLLLWKSRPEMIRKIKSFENKLNISWLDISLKNYWHWFYEDTRWISSIIQVLK